MAVTVDLRISCEQWTANTAALESLCQAALDTGLNAHKDGLEAELDVLLTDDVEMQSLNAMWRGKDKPTDVLSFPADVGLGMFLGDIAIGYGVAARDAQAAKKSLEAHLSHLLIHGLFHLLGYDHIENEEAEIMEALERSALAKLGFDDPYSQIAPN